MHLFCAVVRTHRWLADDQKIRKNKNIYSIRVLFSNVLWNQHRKHHNVQSETRKLLQGANENSDKKQGDCLKRGKTWTDWAQKKNKQKQQQQQQQQKPVLSSATDNIQQTPVTPNTFSSPKYWERRIPREKCHFPKYLTCEENGRVSLNT